MINRKTLLAAVLFVAPFSSWAAEPAPAESIQANPCQPPDLGAVHSGLTQKEAEALNANNKTYQECVQNYVNQQQALANAHLQAAKQAADEFNVYAKALHDKLGASTDKDKDKDAN